METQQLKESLRGFLQEYIKVADFKDDENIFAAKYVNSLFVMQLILFVEKEFAIRVETEDMELANFCSVDALAAFVDKKQSEAAA